MCVNGVDHAFRKRNHLDDSLYTLAMEAFAAFAVFLVQHNYMVTHIVYLWMVVALG
jgi:hypothetical protein